MIITVEGATGRELDLTVLPDVQRYGIVEAARRAGLDVKQIEEVVRRSGAVPPRPNELQALKLKPVVEARLVELASDLLDDAFDLRSRLTEGTWLHNWYQGEHNAYFASDPPAKETKDLADALGKLVDTVTRCVREATVLRIEDTRTEEETRQETLELLDDLEERRQRKKESA